MSIFRRAAPDRLPASALPGFWPGGVSPLDNTVADLSPEPEVPQGAIGTVCDPEFDPCGAGPVESSGGAS